MAKKPRSGVFVVSRNLFYVLWVASTILVMGWVVSSFALNEHDTKVWGREFVRSGGEISYDGVALIKLDGQDFHENCWPWILALCKILLVSAIPALILSYLFWSLGTWFVKIYNKYHQGAPAHA